jgi:nitrile hydratase accessory protein
MTDDAAGSTEGTDPVPLPTGDGPTFDAPWQARAFGLAVALSKESDRHEWTDFQRRLVEETDDAECRGVAAVEGADRARRGVESAYYDRWLTALERLLVEGGDVSPDALAERAAEFADLTRTSAEFVEGDREH